MNDRLTEIALLLDHSGPVAAMVEADKPLAEILREEDDQQRGKS